MILRVENLALDRVILVVRCLLAGLDVCQLLVEAIRVDQASSFMDFESALRDNIA